MLMPKPLCRFCSVILFLFFFLLFFVIATKKKRPLFYPQAPAHISLITLYCQRSRPLRHRPQRHSRSSPVGRAESRPIFASTVCRWWCDLLQSSFCIRFPPLFPCFYKMSPTKSLRGKNNPQVHIKSKSLTCCFDCQHFKWLVNLLCLSLGPQRQTDWE